MNLLTTKAHAGFDYPIALLLLFSPWMFGFAGEGAPTDIPVVAGILLLFGSMVTFYEGGAIPLISMRAHLLFDVLFGLFLAGSPWLFGFRETVFLPHLVMGLLLVVLGLVTEKEPRVKKRVRR